MGIRITRVWFCNHSEHPASRNGHNMYTFYNMGIASLIILISASLSLMSPALAFVIACPGFRAPTRAEVMPCCRNVQAMTILATGSLLFSATSLSVDNRSRILLHAGSW